ncbi:MAG TPA: DUF4232 domain-containing protein [Chloroflexota bacterium]|nr:DUF4232 domain-containing protein [Chloroflexota bacterium]
MKRLPGILGVGAVFLSMLGAPALAGRAAPAAATPRCHTGRLYIAPVPNSGQGGVGHLGLVFKVTSLAQNPCYMYGYPGAQLVDANAHDIPTVLQWGHGYLFGNPPKQHVTLQTGASAYFKLEWVHFPTPGQACPTAGYLLVTPPDERTTIVVPVSLQDVCGGRIVTTPIVSSPS